MSAERPSGSEQHIRRVDYSIRTNLEGQLYTPEFLMLENASALAENNISKYLAAKANNNLTIIDTCADARVAPGVFLNSQEHALLGSIAGGTPRGDLKSIINSPFAKQILVLGHHDGDTVQENNSPQGCGGLHEKHDLCNGHCHKTPETEGLYNFVDKYTVSSDVLGQSFSKAGYTAKLTEKPVMSATVDHLTGKIYPFAVFSKGGRQVLAALKIDEIQRNLEKTGRVTNYENGVIPNLKIEDLPDNFAELIENNSRQVEYLFDTIPNFSLSQKKQNPHTVCASSVLMPLANRYPETYKNPNTHFKVFLPQNIEGGDRYDRDKLIPILEQLKYPLLNAIGNIENGGNFSAVRNLMIETSNISASENICHFLLKDPIVRKWMEVNQNEVNIMAAEITKGKTNTIKSITF